MVTRLYYSTQDGYYRRTPTGLPITLGTSSRPPGTQLRALSLTRPGIAGTFTPTVTQGSVGTGTSIPLVMFASAPLDAVTITGTVKGQMMVNEPNTSVNQNAEFYLFLLDSSWAYKSTLVGPTGPATNLDELSTTLRNTKFPYNGPLALTSQTAASGDRLLVVLGVKQFFAGLGTGPTFQYASTAATDLPEDEVSTTDAAPWVELSQTLTFQAENYPIPNELTYALTHETNLSAMTPPSSFAWQDPDLSVAGEAPVPTEGQIWPRGGRSGT